MHDGLYAMTELDNGTFETAFKRLYGAFRLKLKPKELDDLTATYFRALKDMPLDAVLLAGKTCLATCKRFPMIAEWREALGTTAAPPSLTDDLRWMGTEEASAFVAADLAHYGSDPCACDDCQDAGVTDRPLRFVPGFVDDDTPEWAWCPPKHRRVVAGHWAHGEELRRWYEAKARFEVALRGMSRRGLRLITAAPREPGEEG